MFKNKKILIVLIIIAAILIFGIKMLVSNGLEYGLTYSQNDKLSMYLENGYNSEDIKQISEEALENSEFYIQSGSTNKNVVIITAKEISEEQTNSIIEKINEKYGIELNKDEDMKKVTNPKVEGIDIITPYIFSIAISVSLILIYMVIRYRRVGVIKVIFLVVLSIVLMQLLYISVLAITRIPVTILTMPISLLLFAMSIIICGLKLEKRMKSIKNEQKSK